jgi:hypothetical protein
VKLSLTCVVLIAGVASADGDFFVRRIERLGPQLTQSATVTTTLHTRCESLTVHGSNVQVGALSFRLIDGTLRAPSLRSQQRQLELRGVCGEPLSAEGRYPDLASCQAAPERTVRRCEGTTCTSEGPKPFEFTACAAEVALLEAQLRLLEAASYADAEKSWARFQLVATRGGTMFARGACRPVAFKPAARGMSTSRTVNDDVTLETDYRFEPLFHRAVVLGGRSKSKGGEGASGGPFNVALELGKDAVVLGRETLFFDAASCTTAGD